MVAVSTVVVVSVGEVSVAVVSTAAVSAVAVSMAVAFVAAVSVVAVSTAVAFVGDVSAVAVSTAVAFVVTVLVITDSLMMSSSATSAFPGGGAGAIRTDITVPTIIRTITIGTAGTVTKATPVMDTAMAADQGIFGVCGAGDKRAGDGV